MKNIHVLPTDKPSRLKQNKITKKISLVNKGIDLTSYTPINIYITNSEEIKEGDWVINNLDKLIGKSIRELNSGEIKDKEYSKIILTTDQDLIADGVPAIEDEFLEWFVQNPSCEWVEVKKGKMKLNDDGEEYGFPDMSLYKIIIPKESKQETQTLEEAAKIGEFAEKKYLERLYSFQKVDFNDGVFEGAEWQAERMYSEEEVRKAFIEGHNVCRCVTDNTDEAKECFEEWIKQFKKKKI